MISSLQRIATSARDTPAGVSIVEGEDAVNYAALFAHAGALADDLKGLGHRPGAIVAVAVAKSERFLAACLAVWRSGGCLLLIDPAWQEARLAHVEAVVRPRFRIDTGGVQVCRDGEDTRSAEVGRDCAVVASACQELGVSDLVYVGTEAFEARVECMREMWELSPRDRVAWTMPVGALHGLVQVMAVLTAGAGLEVPSIFVLAVSTAFRNWMIDRRVTVAPVPMPLAGALCDSNWEEGDALRLLLVTGEATIRPNLGRLPVRTALEFGDAAAGVYACLERPPGANSRAEPVTDGHALGRLCPGVAWRLDADSDGGELLVASPYLADRLGDDDLFLSEHGKVYYRTGLRVHRGATGDDIVVDGYVGQRILAFGRLFAWSAFERLFRRHPDVASVRLTADDTVQHLRCAEIAVESRSGCLAREALDAFLHAWLPFTLVPRRLLIDGRGTAALSSGTHGRRAVPRDTAGDREVLSAIQAIWAMALECAEVGPEADFLEIGGDSFHAALITTAIAERFGVRIRMRNLLHLHTPAMQAQHVAGELAARGTSV